MDETPELPADEMTDSTVRSLRELIERVSGHGFHPVSDEEDSGLAENLPFPFLALVGQQEMKLALTLALINPAVGSASRDFTEPLLLWLSARGY
jgi:magnesium chelatase subunit I